MRPSAARLTNGGRLAALAALLAVLGAPGAAAGDEPAPRTSSSVAAPDEPTPPSSVGASDQPPPPSSVGVAAPDAPPDEALYVNREVPDIAIHTADGEVLLSTLWREGPVVLTMVFTRCAGICSPYLRALRRADEALDLPEDVRRVVVSFDPRDTPDHMRRTGEHLGVAGRPGWVLGVAAPPDVERLARALGFWFEWDDKRQQFDHPALLVGIHEGRVARLLVGGSVSAARLSEVVREARGQFVASYPLPGDVLFRCFDYDPVTGAPTLAWGALVLLVPALGAAAATFVIFRRRHGPRRRPEP